MGGSWFTTNFQGKRDIDYLVIKVDDAGHRIWTREYMPDGGFVLGGQSVSSIALGKGTLDFGQGDMWVVRIGEAGEKLWEVAYGGVGPSGRISCSRAGPTNLVYSLESSLDLKAWQPLGPNQPVQQTYEIRDWAATNGGVRRFFRARVVE